MFFIFLADIPNRKLDILSWILEIWGEHVTIKAVLELPPKPSFKIRVNFDYLYGIYALLSIKQLITLPRVVKLEFIFLAYYSWFPRAPVLLTL